ncbi:MAG TPA: hypothetical protein VGG03_25345 [Thermoanaerobaculia bacterium]|jgi:hypothetical protein
MSFREELAAIIKEARETKLEQRDALAKARTEARQWWGDFRTTAIAPALADAVGAWREEGRVFASSGRKNGDAVYLAVRPHNKDPEHELTFRFNEDTGGVVCESSEKGLSETYEKGMLTAEKVRDKIREFVRAAIENYI